MKYTVQSGSLKWSGQADDVTDAALLALRTAGPPAVLGLLMEVSADEEEPVYISTERLLRKHDMWGDD